MTRITYYPLTSQQGLSPAAPSHDGLTAPLIDPGGGVSAIIDIEGGFVGNLTDHLLVHEGNADIETFANAVLPQQGLIVYSFALDLRALRAYWPERAELFVAGDMEKGEYFSGVRVYLDAEGQINAEASAGGVSHTVTADRTASAIGLLNVAVAVDLAGAGSLTLFLHRPGLNSPVARVSRNLPGIDAIDLLTTPRVPRLVVGAAFRSDGVFFDHAGLNVRIANLSIFKYDGANPPDVDALVARNSAARMTLDDSVLIDYPEHFRLRLGAPVEGKNHTGQLLRVITLRDPTLDPVTASIVAADGIPGTESVQVQPLADQIVDELPQRGMWGVTVEFSGLQPFTDYNYAVQQAHDGQIRGSFRSIPAIGDHSREFEVLFATCDGQHKRNPSNLYSTIRSRIEQNSPPVICMMLIDDIDYVDSTVIDDPQTGFFSELAPQDQPYGAASPTLYSKAWARSFGVYSSEPKWRETDRQWVYRNLPCCYSGGDHAIAFNHCRGGVGNPDYSGCDRGPGSLEEAAKQSFDLFYGAMNPPVFRSGKWHWGIEIGSARFALWEISLYCEPYISPSAGGPSDLPRYTAEQIADITAYLSTSAVPFKISMHESGIDAGQPWGRWCPTEYMAWKAGHDADSNLNGVAGSHLVLYGDNHSGHVFAYDTFWAWCPGTMGDSQAVNSGQAPYQSNGELMFADTRAEETGDRFIAYMLALRIVGDAKISVEMLTPEARGRGRAVYARELVRNANDNQMS